ncbi:hypothetical protein TWF730_010000 [Orbilia blumenaviensis]|uniref:Uncharacterized protein n=1 Tax=Orbilia blumenaviensis TaxID=1796055 RepID=A0AAV9UVW7_9PEZI
MDSFVAPEQGPEHESQSELVNLDSEGTSAQIQSLELHPVRPVRSPSPALHMHVQAGTAPVFARAGVSLGTGLLDTDPEAESEGWENEDPSHRFNPNGPFNFFPQIPKGTSNHPESVKRRKIVGKKCGLAAALFRLKESGRSRKRHRKDAIKRSKEYKDAAKNPELQRKMLAEADKTSARELAAKIAACTKVWNSLSPEVQMSYMTYAPQVQAGGIPTTVPTVTAPARRPLAVKTGATNAPPLTQVSANPVEHEGPIRVPVRLRTTSRGPELCLPADLRDVDPELVASAIAKAMPFAQSSVSKKRSASDAGLPEKTRLNSRSETSSPKKSRLSVDLPIEFAAVARDSQSQAVESSYAPRSLDVAISQQPSAAIDIAATSPSRATAQADGILGEAPLSRKRNREAELAESQIQGQSCKPQQAPTFQEKRTASAIRHLLLLKASQAGATGMVILPGPLEQLSEQDPDAEGRQDAAKFVHNPYFQEWLKSLQRQNQ